MTVKILESKGKPAFAVLPYDEYIALRELAEDAQDAAASLARFAKRYASGKEETVPAEVVDRLLAGESPLRVWREFKGMTAAQVAAAVQITPAHVSKIESGKGEPSVALLKKLARVLRVDMEVLGRQPAALSTRQLIEVSPRLCRGTHRGLTYAAVARL
ncbi:MAG: helix-turn-helix transcriptional regulator [Burkholderiales bacterium]